MPIRSNIVNANISHYSKPKIEIYVINFTKHQKIIKIEQDGNIL